MKKRINTELSILKAKWREGLYNVRRFVKNQNTKDMRQVTRLLVVTY